MSDKETMHFGTRWSAIWNRNYTVERRVFAALELICLPVSMLTVFVILPVEILAKHLHWELPGGWQMAFHVMLSAAIGYITNYIALEMLFKPFERDGWHWLSICTLGYWKQGLVPKNKASIGREIGHQVETKLLSPETLANELCGAVTALLSERKLTDDVRRMVTDLVADHRHEINEFLKEKGETVIESMLEKHVTPETLREFLRTTALPRLNTASLRGRALDAALAEVESHSAEIVAMLRQEMQSMAHEYCEKMSGGMGLLSLLGNPSSLVDKILDSLDWESIERRLIVKLHEEKTRTYGETLILQMFTRLDAWLDETDSQEALNELAAEVRGGLLEMARKLLHERVPDLVDQIADYEPLWQWLDERLLPAVLPLAETMIREKGHSMVMDKLKLAERVSASIDKQDTREFYDMINTLAAQHLSAIQVLGYFLGAIIGALQLLI